MKLKTYTYKSKRINNFATNTYDYLKVIQRKRGDEKMEVTVSALGAIIALVVAIILIIKKVHPVYGLIIGALVGGLVGYNVA